MAAEGKPLLGEAKPMVNSEKQAPQRSWRGRWWELLGHGSPEDVSACCLAWNVPYVAFGWNARRAMGRSFWWEMARFALLTVGVFLVFRAAGWGLMMSCMPPPPPMHGRGMDPMPRVAQVPGAAGSDPNTAVSYSVAGTASTTTSTATASNTLLPQASVYNDRAGDDVWGGAEGEAAEGEAAEGEAQAQPAVLIDDSTLIGTDPGFSRQVDPGMGGGDGAGSVPGNPGSEGGDGDAWGPHPGHGGPWHHGHEHPHPHPHPHGFWFGEDPEAPPIPPECAERVMTGMCILCALFICAMLAVVYFAARRRQALREQYGIPGTFLGDCCLWTWCSVCALSQETRTLMHNQVHDGVWYGEVPGAPASAVQYVQVAPPTAGQQMV